MKKLKRKIFASAFVSLVIVFALVLLFSSLGLHAITAQRADQLTKLIENNGGEIPERGEFENRGENSYLLNMNNELRFRTRYFIVNVSDSGEISSADISHVAEVNEAEAKKMGKTALQKKKSTAYIDEYRYRVTDSGYIIFIDCAEQLDTVKSSMMLIAAISLFFVALIMLIFSLVSKRFVRPFEENQKRQKQFITDAGHELKTPLAVISANAEVLEYKDGGSEWVGNIRNQVDYMSKLINELLTLTKLEEVDAKIKVEKLDLTALVLEVSGNFDEMFERRGVSPKFDLQENVSVLGDIEQLRRLVSVLCENAAKYVSENGSARISLRQSGKITELSFFNTCELTPEFDFKRLFDRFYRPDSSRTSGTGGHGIGLSIAREICALHGGSIKAEPSGDGIVFTAQLSNKPKRNKRM